MYKDYFADLHIHIGSAKNSPVKITASKKMTITNILKYSKDIKGLDILGIIDCGSPVVIEELQELIEKGDLVELEQGGLLFDRKVWLIPGSEVEISLGQGRAHLLAYFPNLSAVKEFSYWLKFNQTNANLSSQLLKANIVDLYKQVKNSDGILLPAHAFTPHRSLLGICVYDLKEIMDQGVYFDGIELGLSADSYLADCIESVECFTYFTNSDAHSLPKIAREYNKLTLKSANFRNLRLLINGKEGYIQNFGLHPQLGKYYRSYCNTCNFTTSEYPPSVYICPKCGSTKIVLGVLDRIVQISKKDNLIYNHPTSQYKNYIYQVPLENIPGLGKSTYQNLLNLGTEMEIIHQKSYEELTEVAPKKVVDMILRCRRGDLDFIPGGGGYYGKIK